MIHEHTIEKLMDVYRTRDSITPEEVIDDLNELISDSYDDEMNTLNAKFKEAETTYSMAALVHSRAVDAHIEGIVKISKNKIKKKEQG